MLTLRQRLVLVNLVVFLVTMIVLVAVMSNQILSHFYEQLDQELAKTATDAADNLTMTSGNLRLGGGELQPTGDPDARGFVRLLDAQGQVIDGVGSFDTVSVRSRQFPDHDRGAAANQRSDRRAQLRVYTLPVNAAPAGGSSDPGTVNRFYVQVAAEPEEVLEIVDEIRRSLLLGIPLALLFAGIVGLLAARKALQPLTMMTRSAADISADSLGDRRLPVPRPRDELQALALAFNATLTRLSAAFTRQRRFTADASHELRTPVAAILGQAELALSRPRTAEAYQETMERIRGEAQRMQRLIGRLLALARAESGQQILNYAPTDVTALLQSLTESMALTLESDAVRLDLHAPAAVLVVTDADSLTQILLNLLENAVAHTKQGVVAVRLARQADHVHIQISDDGPGVSPEDLGSIFEPFYRADPSRRSDQGSVGLGLALAQELTHLLGGEISAANRPEGGALFSVNLPVQPAEA